MTYPFFLCFLAQNASCRLFVLSVSSWSQVVFVLICCQSVYTSVIDIKFCSFVQWRLHVCMNYMQCHLSLKCKSCSMFSDFSVVLLCQLSFSFLVKNGAGVLLFIVTINYFKYTPLFYFKFVNAVHIVSPLIV